VRFLHAGTSAVLIELETLEQVMGLDAALRSAPPEGTVDLVPAARTVLVVFDAATTTVENVVADISGLQISSVAGPAGPLVEVPVVYDGEDLAEVAGLSGLSEEEVVARHLRAEYRVAFCGFAPGFAYIVGGDPALRVPRRRSPRTAVPAGSVALADEFTGVYPRQMPGGWQLIGRTGAVLWSLERDQPALLPPGTRVRFVRAQS
jgi:KipI family sensor histidine kinase inhibitor